MVGNTEAEYWEVLRKYSKNEGNIRRLLIYQKHMQQYYRAKLENY